MLAKKDIINLMTKSHENKVTFLEIIRRCGGDTLFGGVLSSLDILTVLYNGILKHDPENPKWEDRDIFLLSGGHKAIGLYVVLQSAGYFEKDILWTYNEFKCRVPLHLDGKSLPGLEFPFGSLGHGLSVGSGIAAGFKHDNKSNRVFVLTGDGEMSEGSVWEAMLSATKYHLDNLILIIDKNNLTCDGYLDEIVPLSPLDEKARAFGWEAKIINGHDVSQIYESLSNIPYKQGKPNCIVANTIKGKGVNFAENRIDYHSWKTKSKDDLEKAAESIELCYREEIGKIG